MKIGILGSGDVAQSLGSGFLKHGHEVMLGTRSREKLAQWLSANPRARAGNFAEAAEFGEIMVLAVKGSAAADALGSAHPSSLAGKTVIDATNPIADMSPDNGVLRFYTSLDDSQMERLQREFADAHFVKAFNSVGAGCMVNPNFPGGTPTMFICGNNEGAKKAVSAICAQFGWEVEDLGPAQAARAIEPLCMLWCIPGIQKNDWRHAFKLLR